LRLIPAWPHRLTDALSCCFVDSLTAAFACTTQGTKCNDNGGSGWGVVTTCEGAEIAGGVINSDPNAGLGAQVCKTGGPLPFSSSLKNVVIMGDSVSIGYFPFVAKALSDVANVQHSPWGGDGGVEETEYGWKCIEYLLRAPDGTFKLPDVLWFNWGLHNYANSTVPGQAGPPSAYAPYLEKIAARLSQIAGQTRLIFGVTSPMLCNKQADDVVVDNNAAALSIMSKYGIEFVDMHAAITDKCGPVPQTSCFSSSGCFCPHCPAHGGIGYKWLAESLIAPAVRKYLIF
jgi:acyl-CoA thioesterase-1